MQRFILLELMVKCIIPTICAVLQIYFSFVAVMLLQCQQLKQQTDLAIQEKNRALRRYRQLRKRLVRRRSKWKNPGRTDKWWRNMLDAKMLPNEWYIHFRMSRDDFFNLEEKLRPYIRPHVNSFRGDTISSCKKLAMTLYYLKDQGSLRMTSNIFGVSPCTLSFAIRKVCNVLVKVLSPELIKFPTNRDSLCHLMSKFEDKFGFPMVVGCVDGTHIPVRQPTENAHDYFCYKMKYSLNVQAVCDYEGTFLDVDCSWPGSVHDAKVFAHSSINLLFHEKKLPDVSRKLNDDDGIVVGLLCLVTLPIPCYLVS